MQHSCCDERQSMHMRQQSKPPLLYTIGWEASMVRIIASNGAAALYVVCTKYYCVYQEYFCGTRVLLGFLPAARSTDNDSQIYEKETIRKEKITARRKRYLLLLCKFINSLFIVKEWESTTITGQMINVCGEESISTSSNIPVYDSRSSTSRYIETLYIYLCGETIRYSQPSGIIFCGETY